MANLGSLLKQEITRLARKEVRTQVQSVRTASAAHRRQIAALNRTVAGLQRNLALLQRAAARAAPTAPAAEDAHVRFVAKGLRSLRTRLGLSPASFGMLAGVSDQSIRNWEAGNTTPGKAQLLTLKGLRSMGKREAQARLAQMAPKASKRGAKGKKRHPKGKG